MALHRFLGIEIDPASPQIAAGTNYRAKRARGGQMVWSPAEILSRALEGCDVPYRSREGDVGLTDCRGIPARTLVLTGTPGGVLFQPLTLWSKAAYLEPGDEVVTVAAWLGVLRNHVR